MLRYLAYFFSIVFHPLLVLTYMLVILLLVNPYLFGVHSIGYSKPLILLIFLSTFFIPFVAISMMKALGMISSFEMKDRTERIGPYIITGIFYLWIFRNILDNPDIPYAYTIFVLGATIALFIAFFINLFSKISMHSVGMGGLLGMVVLIMTFFNYSSFVIPLGSGISMNINTLFMLVVLLSGIVGTSRLLLGAHDIRDLLGGFMVGFGAQIIAYQILS